VGFDKNAGSSPLNNKAIYSLTLIIPLNAYALGLGELKVNSYLNQPLNAEIRLINVGSLPLSGIKADLASLAEFEKVGLEQPYVLSQLTFTVGKNKRGRPVIKITSNERITDPYLEFLLDLTWSNGQIYRSYTILLDPPGYQIDLEQKEKKRKTYKPSYKKVRGAIDKDISTAVIRTPLSYDKPQSEEEVVVASYGPVKLNEDIWEIAQRYKPSNVSLQQVILAIVGLNPTAFEKGNLNGLVTGVRLKIPNARLISKIPQEKAKLEVIEQDKAWRTKSEIKHVLNPPYYENNETETTDDLYKNKLLDDKQQTDTQTQTQSQPQKQQDEQVSKKEPDKEQKMASDKAPIKKPIKITDSSTKKPKSENLLKSIASWPNIFEVEGDKPEILESNIAKLNMNASTDKEKTLNADFAVAVTSIKSLKDSNRLLQQQLLKLKQQNENLQKILKQRDSQIKTLSEQLKQTKNELVEFKERKSIAGQTSSSDMSSDSISNYALLSALAFLILATGGLGFLYLRQRKEASARTELVEADEKLVIEEAKEEQTKEQTVEEVVEKEPKATTGQQIEQQKKIKKPAKKTPKTKPKTKKATSKVKKQETKESAVIVSEEKTSADLTIKEADEKVTQRKEKDEISKDKKEIKKAKKADKTKNKEAKKKEQDYSLDLKPETKEEDLSLEFEPETKEAEKKEEDLSLEFEPQTKEVEAKEEDLSLEFEPQTKEAEKKEEDLSLAFEPETKEAETKEEDLSLEFEPQTKEAEAKEEDLSLEFEPETKESETKEEDLSLEFEPQTKEAETKEEDLSLEFEPQTKEAKAKEEDLSLEFEPETKEAKAKEEDLSLEFEPETKEAKAKEEDLSLEFEPETKGAEAKEEDLSLEFEPQTKESETKEEDLSLEFESETKEAKTKEEDLSLEFEPETKEAKTKEEDLSLEFEPETKEAKTKEEDLSLEFEPETKEAKTKEEDLSLEFEPETKEAETKEEDLSLEFEPETKEAETKEQETIYPEEDKFARPLSGLMDVAKDMNIIPDETKEQASAEEVPEYDISDLSMEGQETQTEEPSLEDSAEEEALSKEVKPIKSESALETLMALAKTYMSMEDWESAKQSLQEIAQYGNEQQISEANKLLQEIEDKE
jgi:pilus assembly protein FimV